MHFRVPPSMIAGITAPVLDIPTPFGVIGGLFGGGKHHPGKYTFVYVWQGIKIDPSGNVSTSAVLERRVSSPEGASPRFRGRGFPSNVAYRLADLTRGLPSDKRIFLILPFNKLNEQFRNVTVSVRLEALRQQEEALVAFETLKYVPAMLNTYGNALRQMYGLNTMNDFLKRYMYNVLNPYLMPGGEKSSARYRKLCMKYVQIRTPADVDRYIQKTGIMTEDLIRGEIPSVVKETQVEKRPAVAEEKEFFEKKFAPELAPLLLALSAGVVLLKED